MTGVRVLPSNPSASRHNTTDNDLVSPTRGGERPKSSLYLQSPTSPELRKQSKTFGNNNPRRAQSQYDISSEMTQMTVPDNSKSSKSNKFEQKPSSKGGTNWQFGDGGRKSRESSLKSHSQRELENNMDDNKLGEKLLLNKKKDAEIASVMQNLRLDYKDTPTLTPGAPSGLNFEKSLGYFP